MKAIGNNFLTAFFFVMVGSVVADLHGQPIFSENFSNPASAASRFTANGNVSYAEGRMTLSPGSQLRLGPADPLPDTGEMPITYSVSQSFGPGSLTFPQYASAEFRVRGAVDSWNDGYYVLVQLISSVAYLQLTRVTDVEIAGGNFGSVLGGGSLIAPPPLQTLGPYQLDVSLSNTPEYIRIAVSINGVVALSVDDPSPYRVVHGDSMGFNCVGTHDASWDNLRVSIVPERSGGILLLLGSMALAKCAFPRRRRNRVSGFI